MYKRHVDREVVLNSRLVNTIGELLVGNEYDVIHPYKMLDAITIIELIGESFYSIDSKGGKSGMFRTCVRREDFSYEFFRDDEPVHSLFKALEFKLNENRG
jgi:hypothetical protein